MHLQFINVNPAGVRECACKGWGFDNFKNFLIKFHGKRKQVSIKGIKKHPPGAKYRNTGTTVTILVELRRPKGLPSGAPYSYRKEKEIHELIFSWLSRLAVLLVGTYASRR